MTDAAAWHRRLVRVRAAHLRHLAAGPGAVHEAADGVQLVVTGVHSNDLNGVLSRAADATGPAVAHALRRVAEHGVPATWLLVDDEVPTVPVAALVDADCRPDLTGWLRAGDVASALARVAARGEALGGVPVVPVRDAARVDAWLDVTAEVWGDDLDEPAGDRARRRGLMAAVGLHPDRPLQHWLAADGTGRVVGAASAFTHPASGTVLVEHLNTVPDARRRGVATALLRAALDLATARGCGHLLLEPSPEGVPLCDALGLTGHRVVEPRDYYLPRRRPTSVLAVEDLHAAEDALQRALRAGDADALDALLADEAAYVGPDGAPVARADDLAAHRSGVLRLHRVDERERGVVVRGDTGVTRVLLDLAGTHAGQPFEVTLRYTRTWHRGPAGWQVLAAHSSAAG